MWPKHFLDKFRENCPIIDSMERWIIENVMHTMTCSYGIKHLPSFISHFIKMAVYIKKMLIKDNPTMESFDSSPFNGHLSGLQWRQSLVWEKYGNSHMESPREMDRPWPSRLFPLKFWACIHHNAMVEQAERFKTLKRKASPLHLTQNEVQLSSQYHNKASLCRTVAEQRITSKNILHKTQFSWGDFSNVSSCWSIFNRKPVSCFQHRCLDDSSSWSCITVFNRTIITFSLRRCCCCFNICPQLHERDKMTIGRHRPLLKRTEILPMRSKMLDLCLSKLMQ